MSQSRRTLIPVVAPRGARDHAQVSSPGHTRPAASNGLDVDQADLDNLAPGIGAVCTPEGPPEAASSLDLPYTANRSLDLSAAEPDRFGCDYLKGRAFLNIETGQIVPARCGRNRCTYCLRANARRRALAITAAKPERAILLTQVGNDWQTVRSRMKRLRHDLASRVGNVQWAWHVEPNPAGTGHHVHAWQRGSFVPKRLLSELADGSGMAGVTFINRVRSETAAGAYGLKGITYGMKGALANDEGLGYLVDNGWRLTHQSRGFFLDADGHPVGVKDAERSAVGHVPGQWVMVSAEVDR